MIAAYKTMLAETKALYASPPAGLPAEAETERDQPAQQSETHAPQATSVRVSTSK